MGLVKDTLDSLVITLKNLARKPVTVQYPRERRQTPERFRGVFALTTNPETGEENCIGCRLCQNICPSQIITVVPEKREKRAYAKDFTLDMNACIFCGLCVQVCPTDAIVMVRTNEVVGYSREDLFLTKEKLLANEKKYQDLISPMTGSALRTMQTPPRPARPAPKPRPKPEEKKE